MFTNYLFIPNQYPFAPFLHPIKLPLLQPYKIYYGMETKETKQLSVEQQAIVDAISANILISQKEVLTVDECAKYLGLSKSYVYKLTMRQQIPHSKPLGKCVFFSRVEIEQWLLSNRVATADELTDRAQAYCAHARTFFKKKGGQR